MLVMTVLGLLILYFRVRGTHVCPFWRTPVSNAKKLCLPLDIPSWVPYHVVTAYDGVNAQAPENQTMASSQNQDTRPWTRKKAGNRIKAQAREQGRPIGRITWHDFRKITYPTGLVGYGGNLTIKSNWHKPVKLWFAGDIYGHAWRLI